MNSLFQVDLSKNCIDEQVWIYHLTKPITKDFEDFIKCFGPLKYPLGEGFSFIRVETKDFLLTGNIGICELKLTVKRNSCSHIKEAFEKELTNYLGKTQDHRHQTTD